jgi:hypothetical protein
MERILPDFNAELEKGELAYPIRVALVLAKPPSYEAETDPQGILHPQLTAVSRLIITRGYTHSRDRLPSTSENRGPNCSRLGYPGATHNR